MRPPNNGYSEEFWLDVRQSLLDADTEVFADRDSSIPDEIAHYTSLQGLQGIIASQKIWCTDIRQVDDQHECDYGLSVIQKVIKKKSVPKWFLDAVLRQTNLFGTKELFTQYIACFCSLQDSSAMWNEYADNGAGFALVFDAHAINAGADGGNSYAFAPVIYDEQTQSECAASVIDRAKHLQSKLELPTRSFPRYWGHEVVFYLMVCGSRFKDPLWRRQQEIRVMVSSPLDNPLSFIHAGKTRLAVPFDRRALIRIVCGPESVGPAVVQDILNRAGCESVSVVAGHW